MLVGPVFTREATTAPRGVRFYAIPTIAVATLLCLLWTYWQIVTGNQPLKTAGVASRFGADAFALLAPLEMAVATLFSALLTSAAVAQEKDRKTLVLLLLSRLTNSELVLGRLLASLLIVLMVVAASAPFFFILVLLGGVSYGQVGRVLAVTVMSALAAGSLGSTIALWREKTFQALAMTILVLVLWLLGWQAIAAGALGETVAGVDAKSLATAMSPWLAVLTAAQSDLNLGSKLLASPHTASLWGVSPVAAFLACSGGAIALLNGLSIAMVRVWNPSRETRAESREKSNAATAATAATVDGRVHHAPGKLREVWDNPILWREMRTLAYGKKVVLIRVAYFIVAALAAAVLYSFLADTSGTAPWTNRIPLAAQALTPLMVVSVLLVNALAVTSITSERDSRALDLLLVTDLTAKEIIYGKLGGVLYNAKEMLVLPLLLVGYAWWQGFATTENLVFAVIGYLVMQLFAAVLGIHCGMTYSNSRQAAGVSLGTLLFLFIGISVCMRMMVALEGGFLQQLTAFIGFIAGGSVAMYATLGWRLESRAMQLASIVVPAATFFVITSFLKAQYGSVFLVTLLAYGLATAAMLVPAVDEFDVATGRTGERTD